MITPADPRMLALEASLKNMPQAQRGQYIQQNITNMQIPLSAAWVMLKAVNRQEEAAKPPDTSTVVEDLAAKIMQNKQQKDAKHAMAQQGGIAPPQMPPPVGQSGPPAGPPPQGPPPGGLPGMPQGAVGQPGSYAGGGIVSFSGDDGSLVGDYWDRVKQNAKDVYGAGRNIFNVGNAVLHPIRTAERGLASYLNNRNAQPAAAPAAPPPDPSQFSAGVAAANPAPAPPPAQMPIIDTGGGIAGESGTGIVPRQSMPALSTFTPAVDEDVEFKKKTKDQLWKESMEVAKSHGVGAAAQAMNAYLDRDAAKQAEDNNYGKHMAVFSAAMKGLAAASQGGANFGGSMAALGTELSDKLMMNKDKMEAAERELARTRFAVQSSVENQDLGEFHAALSDYRDAQKLHQSAVQHAGIIGVEAQKNWVMNRDAILRNQAASMNHPGAELNAAMGDVRRAMASGNKERITRAMQTLQALQANTPEVYASKQRSESAEGIAAGKSTETLDLLIQMESDPDKRNKLIERRASILGSRGGMFDPSSFDPSRANSVFDH